jgi:hydroxymethylbilane synthase
LTPERTGSSATPPPPSTLTVATRRSALALAQCRAFVKLVAALDPPVAIEELQVVTTGDRIQDRPLADIGGKGLFVKEIEEALLDRRADFAVHSIKDVPARLPDGLGIVCIPRREDPRDVLVGPASAPAITLATLPRGARVGTSSLRRMASLRAVRPDLAISSVRGNVDTRLRKLDEGQFDAIVLARAGLVRLGLGARPAEILSADVSLPAVGQGALGIECRLDDEATRARLAPLHHLETAICVTAERGVLTALGGDCRTPLGAHAERTTEGLLLRAFIVDGDAGAESATPRRAEQRAPWPANAEAAHELGLALGRSLLSPARDS